MKIIKKLKALNVSAKILSFEALENHAKLCNDTVD